MYAVKLGTNRWARLGALAAAVACSAAFLASHADTASAANEKAQIDGAIRTAFRTNGIRAVIVQATVKGKTVIKKAYGESMTGVPATTDMHFRNGNVVAPYMSTLLLQLLDQRKVKLTDPISKFVPGMPDGDRVTLQMLAGMTSGYDDYVRQPDFATTLYANPFANFSTKRQLDIGLAKCTQTTPLGCVQFTPGENWSYSHTNYVILGLALEKITGLKLQTALSRFVLRPLGLKNTVASQTAAIPEPVLHTFSSERRGFFSVADGTAFSEETTFWNPSWTFAHGSVQTSDIQDLTRSAIGIGTGKLLPRRLYRLQIDPRIGFGKAQDNCTPGCQTLTRAKGYGLGIFRPGSWIAAQPLFAGLGSVAAYLPSKRISIAVTVAMSEGAFNSSGVPADYHKELFSQIGKILAPSDPPPP